MNSPTHFTDGQLIQSVYTASLYKIVVADKKGMAKLLNLRTGITEDWNACNNPHFIKAEGQLKLFP